MRRRRPWLAALLSLLGGPLGQIYAGRFRRSITLWFIGCCLTCLFFLVAVSCELNPIVLCLFAAAVVSYPLFLAVDAFSIACRSDVATDKWYQRWWVYVGMFLVYYSSNILVAEFVRQCIAEPFIVPGRAMVPTILYMDRLLADKLWSSAETVRRGDVVVFRSAGKDSALYVMRVVATQGDVLEVRDRIVYVNNEKADDIHAFHEGEPLPEMTANDFGPMTIPQRTFFVMGDNRFRAVDSRMIGPIPFTSYYGHAKTIYWSRDYEFRNLDDLSTGIPKAMRWDRIGTRIR